MPPPRPRDCFPRCAARSDADNALAEHKGIVVTGAQDYSDAATAASYARDLAAVVSAMRPITSAASSARPDASESAAASCRRGATTLG